MANTPINAMTATFGSGDQTAIKMNVSDAGPSNSNSKLIDLQLGSVTKFKVTKRGEVIATNYTGSFSGSNFIKNQSSDSGTKYLLFSNGSGQRTVGYDTSLSYDASSNTLTTVGSINAGGDIDSTNVSPLLLSSPTTIGFGGSATIIRIGSTAIGGYTRFDSKQVRGNFTGSFTGSFSGSKGNFTKISGSNGVITGRFIANSFTGSISGGYAAFTKIVGSTFLVTGGVIANSFTGSVYDVNRSKFSKVYVDSQLTASRASLVTVKIEGGTINSTLIGNTTPATITGSAITAFTKFVGNLTGSVYDVNRSKFSKVYVDSQLTASRASLVTVKIEGGTINATLIGNTTPATITGSSGRIENDLVIKGSLQLYNAITGSNSMFISGAGTPIAGYVGIMIGGVKYKMPLYPWT